jgi:3-oxoacyl-[acyl-carrier-protein] synthase III
MEPGGSLRVLPGLEDAMDNLQNRGQPDRSKINMHEPHEISYWTKHLNVSKEELQKAVDKVGNSAAAVRKQLNA